MPRLDTRPATIEVAGSPITAHRQGRRRANLLVVLLSVVLSLLVAEAALHWLRHDYPQFYMLDPLVGWRPRPEVKGWFSGESDTYVAMNREGYRDVDHPLAKAPGTYRIVILGDSMTEGVEVDLEALYWKRLEALLPRCPALAGKPVEALSFAVNGYGTAQEYLTLKRRGLKYRPDLVLLAFFTGNDFTDNDQALGGHRDRPYFTIDNGALVLTHTAGDEPGFAARRRWSDLRQRVFDHSRNLQLISQASSRLRLLLRYGRPTDDLRVEQPGLDSRVFLPPATADWKQAWNVSEALILATAETARNHGAAFAMTTLANPLQDLPDLSSRRRLEQQLGVDTLTYPDHRLSQFAAAHGLVDVPLAEPVASYAAEHHTALHGVDPRRPIGHWNALGHQIAAEYLARGLCAAMAQGRLDAPMAAK